MDVKYKYLIGIQINTHHLKLIMYTSVLSDGLLNLVFLSIEIT